MLKDNVNPDGPWEAGRDAFTLQNTQNGRGNLSWFTGAIDTSDQQMSSMLNMTGYKLASQAKLHDFYSVYGSFSHAVSHAGGSYNPSRNIVSVGYYATQMILNLELLTPEGQIWDAGPGSTVGSNSTGFNIGANLSGGSFGGEPILTGGVSGSFSANFASPDVKFAESMFPNHVQWNVSLPGVGYVSPGVPANPESPSYAGYDWYFGAIFVVPAGSTFALSVNTQVDWNFDYTRGITNDCRKANLTQVYTYQDGSNT